MHVGKNNHIQVRVRQAGWECHRDCLGLASKKRDKRFSVITEVGARAVQGTYKNIRWRVSYIQTQRRYTLDHHGSIGD